MINSINKCSIFVFECMHLSVITVLRKSLRPGYMKFNVVNDQERIFLVLGIALAFVSIEHALLVGLQHCGLSQTCVTVVGMTPGHSCNYRVNSSLLTKMRVPFHLLVALICSTYRVFHAACLFQGATLPTPFFSGSTLFFLLKCDRCRG